MNVCPESTLHLRTNHITIQVKTSATEGFALRVIDTMSVNTVKQLISLQTGILMDSQVLLWNDRKLRDNEILNKCDIKDKSVLQLLSYLSGDTYKVYISEHKVTGFEVSSSTSVAILKEMYSGKDLIFDGKKLESDRSLRDYNIKRGNLIHAVSISGESAVNTLHKEQQDSWGLDEETNSILSLKVRIWADIPSMVSPSQQRLTYKGFALEDNQTISNIGYKPPDQIVVSIPQRVYVRCSDGSVINISIHLVDKIITLKRLLQKETAIEADKQQLYYNGRVMDDECITASYALTSNPLLQLSEFVH